MMKKDTALPVPHPALGLPPDDPSDPSARLARSALLSFADPALRLIDQAKGAACIALGGFGVCVLGVHAAAQAPPDLVAPLFAALAAASGGVGGWALVLALTPVLNPRRYFRARESRHHVFEQQLGSERLAAFEAARGRNPESVRAGVDRLVVFEEGERLLLVRLAVARFETRRAIDEMRAILLAAFAILTLAGVAPITAALAAAGPTTPASRAAGALFLAGASLTLLLLALCERQVKSLTTLLAPHPSAGSTSGLRLLAAVAIEQAEFLRRHEDFFRAPPPQTGGGDDRPPPSGSTRH